MTKLTETQTNILTAGAKRPDNIAMPLPKGLAGAAAKMAVTKMVERGWLQDVDANLRRGEPLWRETGDRHGTTVVVTDAGLLAIGIEPVVVKTMPAIHENAAGAPKSQVPTPHAGTKQATLITMLRAPDGATMEAIIAATGWLPHIARGVMSGALGQETRAGRDLGEERGWSAGVPDQPGIGMIPRLFCGQSVQQPIVNLGRLARGTVDRDHVLRTS